MGNAAPASRKQEMGRHDANRLPYSRARAPRVVRYPRGQQRRTPGKRQTQVRPPAFCPRPRLSRLMALVAAEQEKGRLPRPKAESQTRRVPPPEFCRRWLRRRDVGPRTMPLAATEQEKGRLPEPRGRDRPGLDQRRTILENRVDLLSVIRRGRLDQPTTRSDPGGRPRFGPGCSAATATGSSPLSARRMPCSWDRSGNTLRWRPLPLARTARQGWCKPSSR